MVVDTIFKDQSFSDVFFSHISSPSSSACLYRSTVQVISLLVYCSSHEVPSVAEEINLLVFCSSHEIFPLFAKTETIFLTSEVELQACRWVHLKINKGVHVFCLALFYLVRHFFTSTWIFFFFRRNLPENFLMCFLIFSSLLNNGIRNNILGRVFIP